MRSNMKIIEFCFYELARLEKLKSQLESQLEKQQEEHERIVANLEEQNDKREQKYSV